MKTAYVSAAALVLLMAAGSRGRALAELGFGDQFESFRGTGSDPKQEEAVKRALQSVVTGKLSDMVSKGELEGHKGFQEAVDEVAGNYRAYVNSFQVLSVKSCSLNRADEEGKVQEVAGFEVLVEALVNTARIKRDFEKALRMAELAKLGDNIAAVLEEWAGPEKELKQVQGRLASGAVERAFMNYKFRQVSAQAVQQKFAADLEAGRRLKEEDFKNALLASLKGLGADIIVVGLVQADFLKNTPPAKDSKVKGCVFEVKGWTEAYGRKKLNLLGLVELKAELRVEIEDVEEARKSALSDAGTKLADDLIREIVREKKPQGEEMEVSAPVVLAFENVPESMKSPISSKLEKMAAVEKVTVLRFGREALVFRVMIKAEQEAFLKALLEAFRDEGFGVKSADAGKIVLKK